MEKATPKKQNKQVSLKVIKEDVGKDKGFVVSAAGTVVDNLACLFMASQAVADKSGIPLLALLDMLKKTTKDVVTLERTSHKEIELEEDKEFDSALDIVLKRILGGK